MTTILLHTGKAITPTAEISDAGILIRDGVIEAVGARADVSLPAGAIEIKATDQTRCRDSLMCTFTGRADAT